MKPKPASLFRVEHDYRIFFFFMTAVILGVYFLTLANNPAVRQPGTLILFTLLILIHIVAHWNVSWIIPKRGGLLGYIVLQGVLAYVIISISNNVAMVFSLYMALIGETMGILRSKLRLALALLYFIGLLMLNFILLTGLQAALLGLVGIIPAVIFVSLYVTLYNRQNEARERAQALAAELETANRQLTEYAARVEDLTISTERQRMARELHDTLSQGLAGLILQLEAADAHLAQDHAEKARSIVADAMQQARATLAEARHVIDDLRQSPLDDLEAALRQEVSRFNNATGIPCDFHVEPTPALPGLVKETVLRAAAEALTNIANHARAHAARLDLCVQDQQLLVTIHDDGVGFDAAAIPSGHYGLLGIRERVRLAAGSFDIQSGNDTGTTLKIRIPL